MSRVRGGVAVVTDSTSGLRPQEAAAAGVEVVPLLVVVGDDEYAEGVDIGPQDLAAHLRGRGRVGTSRPAPATFLQVYERLAAAGAERIVSAHLSAELSGTCEAALLAARAAPVPVRVVDTGSIAGALGSAVLAGAGEAERLGGDADAADAVADVIARRCAASRILLYVHSLEHLRRGGRIGAAASLLGGALAVKPILELSGGHLEPRERLRTATRALARLVDLSVGAVEAVGMVEGSHAADGSEAAPAVVSVAVQHVDARARAEKVATELGQRLDGRIVGAVEVTSASAVVATHLGPGTVATIVTPAAD